MFPEKMSFDGLKAGETYFVVMFDDEQLSIPIIQTLRYVGEHLRERDSQRAYFVQLGHAGNETPFFVRKEDVSDLVLDKPQLLRFLELSFSGRLSHPPE
ncbi:hypothetical protein [Tahibacter caeni]|uniref:hypothetical protein n=1 Tax=Tahibacter caeni TaxID=1453545 RepID=UPI00214976CC|nr:hypothetical protein [Tahibacter caeni]